MTKSGRTSTREHEKARSGHPTTRHAKKAELSVWHALHLLHRAGILVSAAAYLVICFSAFDSTLDILASRQHPSVVDPPDSMNLMRGYLGTATIRESPFVMSALQGDTSPRNGTMYLESIGPSRTICNAIMSKVVRIYSDSFLRSVYNAAARDMQYNLTFMASEETELITPVVDCMSNAIMIGYAPTDKFNFLVRSKRDPSEVAIATVQLSNQEYRIANQKERGSAAIGTVTYITDLRASSVKHHFFASIGYPYAEFNFHVYDFLGTTGDGMWSLQKIPNQAHGDISNTMMTSFRSGFFLRSETEQFNINNQVNVNSQVPLKVITTWQHMSTTVMHDSWAWVHSIHLLYGIDMLLSLAILLTVIYRNLQAGKLWIGDAFVSFSSSIVFRGALVLLSWYMNGFWSVFEFCVHDGYDMYHFSMGIYPGIMRADLLSLYLSFCGILGIIFRERVNPLLAMICFFFSFEMRATLLMQVLPQTVGAVGFFGLLIFLQNEVPRLEDQDSTSPMSYWTSHELHNQTLLAVAQTLSSLLLSFVVIMVYIIACKIRRIFFPDKLHIAHPSSNTTGTSGTEDMLLTQKRVLTLFEVATGAELETRARLMSSYENYLFIKGMKFASADGIYSSGFVIANNKYVLKAAGFWSIVLMKVLGRQYKRIFVYAIEGSTVQQTAKLVYLHTFAWTDLVRLNIMVLS